MKEVKVFALKALIIFVFISSLVVVFDVCSNNSPKHIKDNIFVYKDKLYLLKYDMFSPVGKMQDNKILEEEAYKEFENISLDFIKKGAYANVNMTLKNSKIYYYMEVINLPNMKNNYSGTFTLNLQDKHKIPIIKDVADSKNFTSLLDQNGNPIKFSISRQVNHVTYNMFDSIDSIDIISSLR